MKTIVLCVVFGLLANCGFSQFQRSYGTEFSEMGRSLDQLQQVEQGYIQAGYTSKSFIGGLEATLVKTDLNGNQIWARVYGGQDYEYFDSVREASRIDLDDGVHYIAAGITRSFGFGSGDAYLVGVDVNGALTFSGVYGGEGYDIAHCVQNIRDENGRPGYIMVGETRSYSNMIPGTNIYVVRTDRLGNLTRATVIGNRGNQQGMWIEQTRDGGYIIAGATTNYWCGDATTVTNPPTDIFVVKLKPDLTIEWNRIIGSPTQISPNIAYRNLASCVKQDQFGNYVVTGYTTTFGINNSQDAFLLYIDVNGNFTGMKTYGTERREVGSALVETVQPLGNQRFTVVGNNNISTTNKAMLFQTDGGGNLQWAMNYGLEGHELGMELVNDNFERGYAFTGYTTSMGAGGTDIYLVKTTANGKTGTICEKQIELKEVKHEPCVTKSARQVFVDEYRRIDHEVIRLEYKEDKCSGISAEGFGQSQNTDKTLGITLFPNPVGDMIRISTKRLNTLNQVKVYSIQGEEVLKDIKIDQKEGDILLDTGLLPAGVYLVKLIEKNGTIHLKKFLKK